MTVTQESNVRFHSLQYITSELRSRMPSPFPGMNPYLEHPDRWPTVHNRLIVGLADLLTPRLLPKYQVDIDKRVYEVAGLDSIWIGRPDVTVQASCEPRQLPEAVSSVGVVSTPRRVTLPMIEEVREPYLEVRDAQTQAVVSVSALFSGVGLLLASLHPFGLVWYKRASISPL